MLGVLKRTVINKAPAIMINFYIEVFKMAVVKHIIYTAVILLWVKYRLQSPWTFAEIG